MVILDTNIIIDHLRQRRICPSALMRLVSAMPGEELAISTITVQELYTGRSSRDPKAEEYLLATIMPLTILPYVYEIARQAGELARDSAQPLTLADAAIAATALAHGAFLCTLNVRHFREISNLKLLSPENLF